MFMYSKNSLLHLPFSYSVLINQRFIVNFLFGKKIQFKVIINSLNFLSQEGGLGDLKYPLLADFKKEIATSYGVLIESAGIPLRGLFIIDPKGTLRQITVNDLPVGRSVEEVLRLVKAFQFVEKHGEGE